MNNVNLKKSSTSPKGILLIVIYLLIPKRKFFICSHSPREFHSEKQMGAEFFKIFKIIFISEVIHLYMSFQSEKTPNCASGIVYVSFSPNFRLFVFGILATFKVAVGRSEIPSVPVVIRWA